MLEEALGADRLPFKELCRNQVSFVQFARWQFLKLLWNMLFFKATMVRVKEMNCFCRKDSEPKHTDGLQIGYSLTRRKISR